MPTIQDKIYVAAIHDYDPSDPPEFKYWASQMYNDLPPGAIVTVQRLYDGDYRIVEGARTYFLGKNCLTIIGEL